MIRSGALFWFAALTACNPQHQPAGQAQPGVAVINAVPGPAVEKPPPPQPPPLPPPPPIVVTKAEDLPPAPAEAVTVNGWKKIRVGMTVDELSDALGVKISLKDDADYRDYKCSEIRPKGLAHVSIMISDDVVARINVIERGVATYGDVQVGDKAADVKAKFGAALNVQPHFYLELPAEYLTLWTRGGPASDGPPSSEVQAAQAVARGLRFETDVDGVITRFQAGNGAIEWVEGCL